ncbi:MAG TPA: MBL fold metallo-hydrolase [Methylophilaceae bacterium]|nr:MBL fold metallo-hydrolase [Methylophilaceae bacterium]
MGTLHKYTISAACILLAGLAALPAAAQQTTPYAKINAAAEKDSITVKQLRGGVSALYGSGGNIGAFVGKDGIFMVDSGIAVSRQKLLDAIQGLKSGKISYVVNTHWHWDHTDGNGWIQKNGATIIASPETAEHLDQTIRVEEWGHTFTPVEKNARPTVLVSQQKNMKFDGDTIQIRPYMHSHTDGDLSVYFEKADVLFTGDTWWNGLYPFIDYAEGGGIDGMISAANENIKMATEKTIVVPGHGPEGTRADLVAYKICL